MLGQLAKVNFLLLLTTKNIIKTVLFSDSIFIFSKDNTKESLVLMISVIQTLIEKTLSRRIPFYFKGALAHGKISVDEENQIYFGQALIDAYLFLFL